MSGVTWNTEVDERIKHMSTFAPDIVNLMLLEASMMLPVATDCFLKITRFYFFFMR